jgi:flagellar hook assembly protein FlgD
VDLAGAYCYPNPWLPEVTGSSSLKVGGLPAGMNEVAPVLVEIYDLQGELVYRYKPVEPETAFWNGTNRSGNLVRSGMYVVRINWNGQDTVLTLSVVR